MNQEELDLRNKTGEELIDAYNEVAQYTFDDLKTIKSINIKEYLKDKLDSDISNEEFK